MSLVELFSFQFMQRALIAALITGIAAPAVGTFIVQRRLSLMGDGIGHVAVTGVAIGLITGTSPVWTAIIVAIIGATLIEVIRERGQASGDLALALLFYGGLAGGLFLTSLGGDGTARLHGYLFGSLLTLSTTDVVITIVLSMIVITVSVGLAPQLFAVAQDAEFARVAGLKVRVYNVMIAVLAAVTVTVAMRTVGLLLVSALMVVPVATSQQLTRSFRTTLAAAMALGGTAAVGGLVIATLASYRAPVVPGATIVMVALAGFVLAWPVGSLLRRRKRLREPFAPGVPEEHHTTSDHPHEHGPDCGHLAVPHDDHVDYIHDGHRHAPHGEHYDEH
jgi:zinc transport system permease protein